MNSKVIILGMTAALLVGCRNSGGSVSSYWPKDGSGVGQGSTAKNSALRRSHLVTDKWSLGYHEIYQLLELDPELLKDKEAKLLTLVDEQRPGSSVKAEVLLGRMYQRTGRSKEAAELFHKYLNGAEAQIATHEAYEMYLACKAAGQEMDSRLALIRALKGMRRYPVSYTDVKETPSIEAIRVAEMDYISRKLSGAELYTVDEGRRMLKALAKKDGLPPKLMSAIAFNLGKREPVAVGLLKRLVLMQGPEAKMAREDLIQWGEMPSDNEPMKWVKVPTHAFDNKVEPPNAKKIAEEGGKARKEGTPGYTFTDRKNPDALKEPSRTTPAGPREHR